MHIVDVPEDRLVKINQRRVRLSVNSWKEYLDGIHRFQRRYSNARYCYGEEQEDGSRLVTFYGLKQLK